MGPDADHDELEIGNHHYPGPTGPEKYRNSKRPITFDEFCHLNAYNRLELAADPGLHYMWGRLLDQMWTDMYNSKGVLGGAIWAGIDDTFFLPEEMAVGYGTWGPIDGWRREKPEYWEMKKAFSPVRIVLNGNMDENGLLLFDVENRHNFTNLSECTVQWKVRDGNGTVQTSIEPRQKGILEIRLPEKLRNTQDIELTITSPRGFVIDEYTFRIVPEQISVQTARKQKISVSETDGNILVTTPAVKLTVDGRNGLLSIGHAKGALLQASPALMLLPLNQEGEGIQMVGKNQNFHPYTPVCSHWVCESVKKKHTENGVKIEVQGEYREAKGSFTYAVSATGEISVSYDFTVLHNVSPRQTGIVFTLPGSFDFLKWKRKGHWNVYPSNQVGALEGEAKAMDPALPVSEIAGPSKEPAVDWAYDQTANGSNMFRSTKENIVEASLTGADGYRFTVLSDGTQHSRAWKDGEFVQLLVADYSNPGSERFLISHAEKEYRPLRKGDRLTGTVNIQLNR